MQSKGETEMNLFLRCMPPVQRHPGPGANASTDPLLFSFYSLGSKNSAYIEYILASNAGSLCTLYFSCLETTESLVSVHTTVCARTKKPRILD